MKTPSYLSIVENISSLFQFLSFIFFTGEPKTMFDRVLNYGYIFLSSRSKFRNLYYRKISLRNGPDGLMSGTHDGKYRDQNIEYQNRKF